MRNVSLLVVLLSLSVACAKEGEAKSSSQPKEQQKIPTTLAEAHAELERLFPSEELAKIDAMESEDDMALYHLPFGAGLRNSWGLWQGSPLAKHMQALGFTHADDMSGVILYTFWCKRHGKDFRLEERAARYRKYWDQAQHVEKEKESRAQKDNEAIRSMMMGLRLEKREVPVVRMPIERGMNVRFMCPFHDGVFLTAYCQGSISSHQYTVTDGHYADPVSGEFRRRPDMDDSVVRGFCMDRGAREPRKMKPGEDVYTLGFHFDLNDRKIRRICVPEVNEVYAAVVVGGRAWLAGLTNGKAVLAGIGARDRMTLPLPQEDEIPDLGMDGQSLLAVYSKTIYRLVDREWMLIHSGDILLPRSGLPPQRHGNMVFLRDEGRGETRKRFWWLLMGEKPELRLLARNTGLFQPVISADESVTHLIGPPGWEEASSYCVTSSGDLWACVGAGSFLIRRSKDGIYRFAVAGNSVEFTASAPGGRRGDEDLSISAVTPLPDDTLLLAGQTGLYRLKGNELTQELAFTRDRVVDASGRTYSNAWTPNTVLALDDGAYVLGTAMWDGVYLLRKGDDGQWVCLPAERTRDTVVW